MGETTDTLRADSKSDDIKFLDRNAGRILIWTVAISCVLRLISLLMSPSRKQWGDVIERLRKADGSDEELELDLATVVWGVVGVSIGLLAGLVSFVGKVLALIGYTQRGSDRDRRRRAE